MLGNNIHALFWVELDCIPSSIFSHVRLIVCMYDVCVRECVRIGLGVCVCVLHYSRYMVYVLFIS